MSINLSKGSKVVIGKTDFTIGLGWTPNGGSGQAFDLDCSVFMLDANKMIPTEKHFIFYGNKESPDGAVKHSGDDRSGASTTGDDERITVNTALLDPTIQEILVVVTIDEAAARRQNFGQVRDSYVRIIDNATGEVIKTIDTTDNKEVQLKYELDEHASIDTAMEFARIYKKDGEWKFDASGIGYQEDLAFFVQKYYSGMVVK